MAQPARELPRETTRYEFRRHPNGPLELICWADDVEVHFEVVPPDVMGRMKPAT